MCEVGLTGYALHVNGFCTQVAFSRLLWRQPVPCKYSLRLLVQSFSEMFNADCHLLCIILSI